MTPVEKLAKIKDILFKTEPTETKNHFIDHDAAENLVSALISLKYDPEYKTGVSEDSVVVSTIKRVIFQIEQVKDVLKEPESRLGDRFPSVIHHDEWLHDEHKKSDPTGW